MSWIVSNIANIASAFLIIVFCILLYNRKKYSIQISWLLLAFVVNIVSDLLLLFVIKVNNPIYNLVFISFIFFFILELFLVRIIHKKYYYVVFCVITIAQVINLINVLTSYSSDNNFSYTNHAIAIVLLFIIIMIFLYETLNSQKVLQLFNYIPFYVVVYVMINFVGTLPILLLAKTGSNEVSVDFFRITINTIIIIGYLVLCIGSIVSLDKSK